MWTDDEEAAGPARPLTRTEVESYCADMLRQIGELCAHRPELSQRIVDCARELDGGGRG